MWRRRVGWLLCILAALEMYLFQNSAGTRALLAAVVCVPLLMALAVCLPGRETEISLALPESAGRGEEILCKLLAECPARMPLCRLHLRLELENCLTGEKEEPRAVLSAGLGRKGEALLKLTCAHSGLLVLRITGGEAVDIFGLWARPVSCRGEGKILILPEVFPVELSPASFPDCPADGEAVPTQKPGRDSGEIFRIREYVPGDPVRQIHWKLSQKADKVLVREFSAPGGGEVLLALEAAPVGPEGVDAALDLLFSVGQVLGEEGGGCTVRWPSKGAEETRTLCSAEDWGAFQIDLLSRRLEPVRLRMEGITVI